MVKPDELITGRQMGPRGTVGAEQHEEKTEHTLISLTHALFYVCMHPHKQWVSHLHPDRPERPTSSSLVFYNHTRLKWIKHIIKDSCLCFGNLTLYFVYLMCSNYNDSHCYTEESVAHCMLNFVCWCCCRPNEGHQRSKWMDPSESINVAWKCIFHIKCICLLD